MTLVRYDARGFALSDRGELDFSCEALASDIEAVLEAVHAERAALLANSIMAAPAIQYAATHPGRVGALLLLDGLARGSDLAPGWNAVVELARADWEFAKQTLARAVNFPAVSGREKYQDVLEAATTQAAFLRFFEAVKGWDMTHLLERIDVPTLVTHTGPDLPHVPLEACRRVATSIPNAEFASIPGHRMVRFAADFLQRHFPAEATAPDEPQSDAGAFRTVLFTDIVGHTEMMQRLGDERGRAVLREHERITREVLRAHGGTEVKTMGDGFMASFGSVTKAMDCAIALQRAFAVWNNEHRAGDAASDGTEAPSLHVRVGLNAGEPIEEEGDLFGATVILASRICGKAGAGEILIPEPLRHLLAGKSYTYADRGEAALKGFADTVRLYEVRWRE
jgi:class 3 adenylate cyclase